MTHPHITPPPQALQRCGVTLHNITLVPASPLPLKAQYIAIAKQLPCGSVLLDAMYAATIRREFFDSDRAKLAVLERTSP